jgi:hypothetical protein
MSDLAKGSLVRHDTLGIGKVVAVEATAVHVFFPESDKRQAAKLRWPLAKPFLQTEVAKRDAWLEGLSSFALDPDTGRYSLAESWLTHDQAVAEFLARVPEGFAGAARGGRTSRWRAAGALWAERLGSGQGEALLEAGDVPGLVKRALEVERLAARVPGILEEGSLRDAFASPEASRAYFEALLELLAVPKPGRARFEKLFTAVSALGAPASVAWPLATLFPFLAQPGRHMLLHARTARAAAERLGCDLRYEAAPNWTTYAKLRDLATGLLGLLAPLGAADLADAELFLHAVATRRPAAGRAERPAERHAKPAPRQGAAARDGAASTRAAVRGTQRAPSSNQRRA